MGCLHSSLKTQTQEKGVKFVWFFGFVPLKLGEQTKISRGLSKGQEWKVLFSKNCSSRVSGKFDTF